MERGKNLFPLLQNLEKGARGMRCFGLHINKSGI
jgi:hypothetical protein